MSQRGTDDVAERRKAGPRNESKVGVESWIENVFFGFSEVVVLGLPTLVALLTAPYNVKVKSAAIVAVATLSLAIGTVRQTESLDWPSLSPALFVIKVVYHSVVIAIVAAGGAAVDVLAGSAVGSFVVALVLSLCAVWLFPRFVAWIRRLPPWWTWGR